MSGQFALPPSGGWRRRRRGRAGGVGGGSGRARYLVPEVHVDPRRCQKHLHGFVTAIIDRPVESRVPFLKEGPPARERGGCGEEREIERSRVRRGHSGVRTETKRGLVKM